MDSRGRVLWFLVFALFMSYSVSATEISYHDKELYTIPFTAAVALRDDVNAGQKWITQIFIEPFLESYYEKYSYITLKSEKDEAGMNRFQKAVEDALKNYEVVDVYILAHKNEFIKIFKKMDPDLRKRLRFVYNTGCSNAAQGKDWLKLGVKSYVGHAGLSWSPIFMNYFIDLWVGGWKLNEAVVSANKSTEDFIYSIRGTLKNWKKVVKDTKASVFGVQDVTIYDLGWAEEDKGGFDPDRDSLVFCNKGRSQECAFTMRQFFNWAKFLPDRPLAKMGTYKRRIYEVLGKVDRKAWPDGFRVPIPGYANLWEFSRDVTIQKYFKKYWKSTSIRNSGATRFFDYIYTYCKEVKKRVRETVSVVSQGYPVVWVLMKNIKRYSSVLVFNVRTDENGDYEFDVMKTGCGTECWETWYIGRKSCRVKGRKLQILYPYSGTNQWQDYFVP